MGWRELFNHIDDFDFNIYNSNRYSSCPRCEFNINLKLWDGMQQLARPLQQSL